jgi:hypothetical protein
VVSKFDVFINPIYFGGFMERTEIIDCFNHYHQYLYQLSPVPILVITSTYTSYHQYQYQLSPVPILVITGTYTSYHQYLYQLSPVPILVITGTYTGNQFHCTVDKILLHGYNKILLIHSITYHIYHDSLYNISHLS